MNDNGNGDHGYISIIELASEFGIHPSQAHRSVASLGIRPTRRRLSNKGQAVSIITLDEAELVRRARYGEGVVVKFVAPSGTPIESGYFYIIRLVPDLDPRRLKFGFAVSVDTRLAEHRTSAPTAEVTHVWPCRRTWERTVIDCLSGCCRLIMGEVYECDDLATLIHRGEILFSILPTPDSTPPLAICSPYVVKPEVSNDD